MKQEITAGTHRSLERGLSVLEMVASSKGPASLAEITRRLGLHRSTAHHLMQALVAAGYLRQEKASRGYMLTSKLYALTGRLWSVEQLGEIALPLLRELTLATGEGTSVAAWIDGEVMVAAKCEPDVPVRVVQAAAGSRPMYCTAVGKAIAAWLPWPEVKAALARTRMERLTPKTITTPSGFETELGRIRAAGYALDDEEQYAGLRCIAMPVFCHTGQVFASMCVLGPKHRMTYKRIGTLGDSLREISHRLSKLLGGA